MKKTPRPILIGLFMLILLNSACTALARTEPTAVGTILSASQTALPTSTGVTATGTPLTPIIPITGENVVEMQCQFCVNDLTHAVFIFPDFAIFDVESALPVTCMTAEVINGQRVLVCYGQQSTSFNLKICSDNSNCLLYPVSLQPCPLIPNTGGPAMTATAMTPVYLTAINTLRPPSSPNGPTTGASPTPTPVSVLPTATGIVTQPAIPTTVAPPPTVPPQPTATEPPPPTEIPRDTNTPRPTHEPRPSHTPKPTKVDTRVSKTPRP
jgi:hypothetical protein